MTLVQKQRPVSFTQQVYLAVALSIPGIIAQLSSITMQYIDAAMVGRLGHYASASVGLVITSTWLFWGLCTAIATGFSVQVAHRIGAGDREGARAVLRQAISATLLCSVLLAGMGIAISAPLPYWLGGDASVAADASRYFLLFVCSIPALQLNFLASGMLRSSGNMLVPGVVNAGMCLLDVIFNCILIFPSRCLVILGSHLYVPGADLGVSGAAIGTAAAYGITAIGLLWYLCARDRNLKLTKSTGSFRPQKAILYKALRIALPMATEHVVFCGAQILTTIIVAPLGMASIAANSFAITAESICYMPGYGIAEAATTLIGQSLGAMRVPLAKRFAWITVFMGMAIMMVMGALMYGLAPVIMGFMTPDPAISALGVEALRIEAFAEPMFAASIVAYGVFVGSGNTFIPSVMNLASIWGIRLTLAAILAPVLGLRGIWLAMCIELCFRGLFFLIRLYKGRWYKSKHLATAQQN